jgi:thiol-disulfide isomerase/thioredoxin
MNNTFVWILTAVVVIGIGAYAINPDMFTQSDTKETMMEENGSMEQNNDSMMQKEDTMEKMEADDSMMMKDDSHSSMEKDSMMEEEWTEEEMAAMEDDHMAMEGDVMVKTDTMMSSPGEYVDFSESVWNGLYKKEPFVLFFHASWCPSCKQTDSEINADPSKIPTGTTIVKVNYDTSADLKKEYGVTYQHTYVYFDAQGNMVKKTAGDNFAKIIETLETL